MAPCRSLVVNGASMADLDDSDDQHVVLQLAYHAVVSYPVTPQSAQTASKGFSSQTRIRQFNGRFEVGDDTLLPYSIDLAKLLLRRRVELNAPAQDFA